MHLEDMDQVGAYIEIGPCIECGQVQSLHRPEQSLPKGGQYVQCHVQLLKDSANDIFLRITAGDDATYDIVRLSSTKYPVKTLPNGPDSVILTVLAPPTPPATNELPAPVDYTPCGLLIRFASPAAQRQFALILDQWKSRDASTFDAKMDRASSDLYFHYYGMLSQQQNMLQDAVRTGGYYWAIMENREEFEGKVVVDVGAGTGILAVFAAMAGARKVYAVEASDMAKYCRKLLAGNPQVAAVIEVIQAKVEACNLPEQADILVSEPMGTLLVNERMLETYLYARDKFLRPGGNMYPRLGVIRMAGYQDEFLQQELLHKSLFWGNPSYYGVNLQPLYQDASAANFKQVVVDAFDPGILTTPVWTHEIDFLTIQEASLFRIQVPINTHASRPLSTLHGVACWFDVLFDGKQSKRWLSTAPGLATTHWFQMRLPFQFPIQAIPQSSTLSGHVTLLANERQSYDISVDVTVDVTASVGNGDAWQGPKQLQAAGTYDLKDPYYRQIVNWNYPPPMPSSTPSAGASCPTRTCLARRVP